MQEQVPAAAAAAAAEEEAIDLDGRPFNYGSRVFYCGSVYYYAPAVTYEAGAKYLNGGCGRRKQDYCYLYRDAVCEGPPAKRSLKRIVIRDTTRFRNRYYPERPPGTVAEVYIPLRPSESTRETRGVAVGLHADLDGRPLRNGSRVAFRGHGWWYIASTRCKNAFLLYPTLDFAGPCVSSVCKASMIHETYNYYRSEKPIAALFAVPCDPATIL